MAVPKASNTLAPIPYEIMKRLTLPEQNLLRSYIEDITAHAADDCTPSAASSQPREEQFDIIRLSFYVIITIASILAVLCVYNSCIR